MELNFVNKGLSLFDATVLDDQSQGGPQDALLGSATGVETLNLAHNFIRLFITGESLRFVTVVDLSHNALNTLRHCSFPPGLAKLNLSHNELEDISTLGRQCPRLKTLDASHNAITSAGCETLSTALTTLQLHHNEISSFQPFSHLGRLQKLIVSFNAIERVDEEAVSALARCKSLRMLDLRENPCLTAADETAVPRIAQALPRLSALNGVPQSQAAGNAMAKAARRRENASASSSTPRHTSSMNSTGANTSTSGGVPRAAGALNTNRPTTRPAKGNVRRQPDMPLAIRAMETKVQELYRLLAEATKEETAAQQDRNLVAEQIRSLSSVIDGQATEMESLHEEIKRLKEEQSAMREPLSELEQTFEQNHASLVAHRVQDGGNMTV